MDANSQCLLIMVASFRISNPDSMRLKALAQKYFLFLFEQKYGRKSSSPGSLQGPSRFSLHFFARKFQDVILATILPKTRASHENKLRQFLS